MAWNGSTGALFTSLTVTMKLFVALSDGVPLSSTSTVIRFVLGPWSSLGVHARTPVLVLMVIPAGAVISLKVRILSGTSASVAVLVTTRVRSSSILWLGGTTRMGALFTSSSTTVTVKLPVVLSGGEPLSVTRTVMRLVLRSCASVGVQVNTPLPGSRLAPSGADTSSKEMALAGTSGSVALLVTTSVASPWITLLATVSTGARFTSLTMTVKLLVSLRAGTPLSVTFTLIRLVLGP